MVKFFKKTAVGLSNKFKSTDLVLVLMAVGGSLLSVVLMASLFSFRSISSARPILVQSVSSFMGFIAAMIISNIDYHKIVKFWKPIAIFACGLSLILFTPIGRLRGGNSLNIAETGSDNVNWFSLGFTTVQPSEFLKIAFIITFAFHCSMVFHVINQPKVFVKLIAHAMVPVLIIFLQKDYGTMIVFVFIAASMLFVSGINWQIISTAVGVGFLLLVIFFATALSDFRLKRFAVLGNVSKFKDSAGFQQYRGQLVLSSGRIFGKSFFSDDMLDAPELYNDMIYAHVGQTLGFLGCVAVLIWILVFCLRILQHAKNAQDNLGFLICVGAFSLILIQAIINLGMVLVIMPVIGVNLPFFSNGGTSNLMSYIVLGLVLSVYKNSFKTTLF